MDDHLLVAAVIELLIEVLVVGQYSILFSQFLNLEEEVSLRVTSPDVENTLLRVVVPTHLHLLIQLLLQLVDVQLELVYPRCLLSPRVD